MVKTKNSGQEKSKSSLVWL